MKNILIVNRKTTNCGVHQYGLNIFESLKKSTVNSYFYLESNDIETVNAFLANNNVDVVVFNYIIWVMGWVTEDFVNTLSQKYDCHFIFHDGELLNFNCKSVLYCDPTRDVNNINEFNIKRCLFDYKARTVKDTSKIIISSFGFGFPDKGFQNTISRINEEFTGAVIRFHIPNANVDWNDNLKNETLKLCYSNYDSKNELIITNKYMTNDELLDWLSESSINCFFYDKKPSKGISSVIDYALSVDIPIATTNCDMMRHIISDKISIEKHSISSIISYGCDHLLKYKEEWSSKNFRDNFDSIMNR